MVLFVEPSLDYLQHAKIHLEASLEELNLHSSMVNIDPSLSLPPPPPILLSYCAGRFDNLRRLHLQKNGKQSDNAMRHNFRQNQIKERQMWPHLLLQLFFSTIHGLSLFFANSTRYEESCQKIKYITSITPWKTYSLKQNRQLRKQTWTWDGF